MSHDEIGRVAVGIAEEVIGVVDVVEWIEMFESVERWISKVE